MPASRNRNARPPKLTLEERAAPVIAILRAYKNWRPWCDKCGARRVHKRQQPDKRSLAERAAKGIAIVRNAKVWVSLGSAAARDKHRRPAPRPGKG